MTQRMRIAVAVSSAAALGAVATAIVLGERLAEPTVVPDPYQAGLHYGQHGHHAPAPPCDVTRARCDTISAQGVAVSLDVGPRPLRAMQALDLTVRLGDAGRPVPGAQVEVALTMPGMRMGENRVRLAATGDGRYAGRGTVVRCPSGGRTWNAEVTAARPQGDARPTPVTATFRFDVEGG